VPVFVAAGLPAVNFVNIIYKTLVSIKKNEEKTYVGPERRCLWRRSGPFSLRLPSLLCILLLDFIKHWLVLENTKKMKKKAHLGPERHVWRRLGPFSSSSPSLPSSPSFSWGSSPLSPRHRRRRLSCKGKVWRRTWSI
jgi:hypothetical protein